MLTIDEAIAYIQKANPYMGNFLSYDGSLVDYVKKEIMQQTFNPIHLKRQSRYQQLIKDKITQLFPTEDLRVNTSGGMIVDTTAHHNILNFPTIIGAHMISRFDTILDRESCGDYYVLDCGNIPFSEVLHKRGVEFQGKHLNLYPRSARNKLVSRYPLYEFNLREWIQKSAHQFSKKELAFIDSLQEIIDSIDFSSCTRLSDQIVKINHRLWLELFDENIRDDVRRCITLEHDEILITRLQSFFLEDDQNIIYRALFDVEVRQKVLELFDGIYGAWNYSGAGTGTHFFWGFCPEDGKTYQLRLKGNVLHNTEGKIAPIPLEASAVVQALKEGILIPSIFTKFGFVASYMGAVLMGGPGQTEYAGKLHDAWIRLMEMYDQEEARRAKQVTGLHFNCGDLAFTKDDNGAIIKQWGWDMAMTQRFDRVYIERLGNMPFRSFVLPFVPISLYRLMPAEERKELAFSEQELVQAFQWVN